MRSAQFLSASNPSLNNNRTTHPPLLFLGGGRGGQHHVGHYLPLYLSPPCEGGELCEARNSQLPQSMPALQRNHQSSPSHF
jgi:hypothetical protein